MDSKYSEDDGCKGADSDEEYLPGASTPDYLGRAIAFYQSRPFHGPLDAFVQRHAHEFSDAAEVTAVLDQKRELLNFICLKQSSLSTCDRN